MRLPSLRAALSAAACALALLAPAARAQTADLALQNDVPAIAAPGTSVTFVVLLVNTGPDAATAITLTNSTPALTTFQALAQVAGPPMTCAQPAVDATGDVVCTLASLAAFDPVVLHVTVKVDAGAPAGTFITGVAFVSSPDDPNEENNSGPASTMTSQPTLADVSIQKSAAGEAVAGGDIVYTLQVANAGPAVAVDVTVTDPLPAGLTFVALAQSGTALGCTTPAVGAGGTISCTRASYPAGEATTLTLTAKVPDAAALGTSYANTASIASVSADPNAENDGGVASAAVADADVSVTIAAPATSVAGQPLAYTIAVADGGPSVAQSFVLTLVLPPPVTFTALVQNTGPTLSCSLPVVGTNGTVTCTLPSLNAAAQFTLTVDPRNALAVTQTADVTATTPDPALGNNHATASTAITPVADLAVTKTVAATASTTQPPRWTLTVANAGPSDATNVTLTDVLPPGLAFAGLTQTAGPPFACTTPAPGSGGTVSCTAAALPVGASAAFDLWTTVDKIKPGAFVTNIATVAAATGDPGGADNAATAATLIVEPVVVPTLAPTALALLGLLLLAGGLRTRRR